MWHLTLLSVAWMGEEPPYVVQLSSADTSHRVLIEKEGVQAQRIRLPIPDRELRDGFLRLTVRDSIGQEVEAVFELIPRGLVPSPDRTWKQSEVPDEAFMCSCRQFIGETGSRPVELSSLSIGGASCGTHSNPRTGCGIVWRTAPGAIGSRQRVQGFRPCSGRRALEKRLRGRQYRHPCGWSLFSLLLDKRSVKAHLSLPGQWRSSDHPDNFSCFVRARRSHGRDGNILQPSPVDRRKRRDSPLGRRNVTDDES